MLYVFKRSCRFDLEDIDTTDPRSAIEWYWEEYGKVPVASVLPLEQDRLDRIWEYVEAYLAACGPADLTQIERDVIGQMPNASSIPVPAILNWLLEKKKNSGIVELYDDTEAWDLV